MGESPASSAPRTIMAQPPVPQNHTVKQTHRPTAPRLRCGAARHNPVVANYKERQKKPQRRPRYRTVPYRRCYDAYHQPVTQRRRPVPSHNARVQRRRQPVPPAASQPADRKNTCFAGNYHPRGVIKRARRAQMRASYAPTPTAPIDQTLQATTLLLRFRRNALHQRRFRNTVPPATHRPKTVKIINGHRHLTAS